MATEAASLTRRAFLAAAVAQLACRAESTAFPNARRSRSEGLPTYLSGHEHLYAEDPRQAALRWFVGARYGLFVHYSLGSLLEGGTAEIKRRRRVLDWKKLQARFTAEAFDAERIAQLAVDAQMSYVNFTTCHAGRMWLCGTEQFEFNSVKSPARRDLVGEMAEACRKKGLGLFLYVPVETAFTTPGDVLARNRAVLRELLTQYGPIAGIWFDGVGLYYKNPDRSSRLAETYELVRSLQPQCLISYKTGALGEEDFLSPEEGGLKWVRHIVKQGKLSPQVWQRLRNKPIEICTTMQVGEGSLWLNQERARHRTGEEVWGKLSEVLRQDRNLLLNVGPRGDGSIHPADVAALRAAGERIRRDGFPGSAEGVTIVGAESTTTS